jgi:hypothetical protein
MNCMKRFLNLIRGKTAEKFDTEISVWKAKVIALEGNNPAREKNCKIYN